MTKKNGRASEFASCLAFGFVLLASVACSSGDEDKPEFIPGGCGLAAYRWLPTEQVGSVVSFSEIDGLRYSAATIDAMLTLAGADMFTPSPFGIRVFRLRYSTQDKGQAIEATGLVVIPWIEGETIAPRPQVLFTHGTTGFANACAPSFDPDEGDIFPPILLASRGYLVAAPDYIGLDGDGPEDQRNPRPHAYLGLEQTAIASFDCLRAMQGLLTDELAEYVSAEDRLVLWGGSQGGHAVFACQLFAQHYAPEFDIRASVAMVPPTDLQALAQYAVSSPNPATIALTAVMTSLHNWYEGTEALGDVLTETVAGSLEQALFVGCDADEVFEGLEKVNQIYVQNFIEAAESSQWSNLEPWTCYLEQNSVLGSGLMPAKHVPTLFVVSELDELVYAPSQRTEFELLCQAGYQLDYLECLGASHAHGAVFSLPEQFDWVAERLAGQPIPTSDLCVIEQAQYCSADPDAP